MLEHTFCHLPGIGPRSEQALWNAGVQSWHALANPSPGGLSPAKRAAIERGVELSRQRLGARDARFFSDALAADQAWRLYRDFKDAVAYLDIETTGLGGYGDHVTTIALYDGKRVRHYIHGRNLDAFARDVRDYRLLVTYNGKCFDLPFLRQSLGVEFPQRTSICAMSSKAWGSRAGSSRAKSRRASRGATWPTSTAFSP